MARPRIPVPLCWKPIAELLFYAMFFQPFPDLISAKFWSFQVLAIPWAFRSSRTAGDHFTTMVYGMTQQPFWAISSNERIRNWKISRLENHQRTKNELYLIYLMIMKTFGNVLFRDSGQNGSMTNLSTTICTDNFKSSFVTVFLNVVFIAVTSYFLSCHQWFRIFYIRFCEIFY